MENEFNEQVTRGQTTKARIAKQIVDPAKHQVKNRNDKRYLSVEKRIHQGIDEMIANKDIKTQTLEFSKFVGINSCTFYRHYTSVPHAITHRDQVFFEGLKRCTDSKSLPIVYHRIFLYFDNNRLHFTNVKTHLNTDLVKAFVENDLKPIIYRYWRNSDGRLIVDNISSDHIYRAHCYELLREYHDWATCENFSRQTIDSHVRRLVYLTDTARYRFGRIAGKEA